MLFPEINAAAAEYDHSAPDDSCADVPLRNYTLTHSLTHSPDDSFYVTWL